MPVKVLIADDSGFFRRRIAEIVSADPALEVVGMAENGRDAVQKTLLLRPDVITMDIEMPVMDGIQATREIMRSHPTPILMFSSLTHEGATATLNALNAGAVDFLPKRLSEICADESVAKNKLRERLRVLGGRRLFATTAAPIKTPVSRALSHNPFRLAVLVASTGGPAAVQQILLALPADFRVPILVVQHMPASFTGPFAERLNDLCAIQVCEARAGDSLLPGKALIAPGGRQTSVVSVKGFLHVHVYDDPGSRTYYRPCADITLRSVTETCGGHALSVILTGMGRDGCDGATALKQAGGAVWAQDEETSIIFGMPGAVIDAGVADRILALSRIGPDLAGAASAKPETADQTRPV
ncbi:MAG: chemotaxis response regulator protein-glutamate methylesterase [Pseudomonadota bacterium]|nr:chemotaxis response regulator protein-glutamate methylesterase [Pseudomonadota bacterium]